MATKNIFELLPDSDSETEKTNKEEKKPVKTDKKKEKNNQPSAQGQSKPKENKAPAQREERPTGNQPVVPKKKATGGYAVEYLPRNDDGKDKKHEKSDREGPKQFKGVPAEPHPLDRRSGTGRGKEVSKSGAGRRNWGTFEDDTKENRGDKMDEKEYEQQFEAVEVVPEEPEQFTLDEYYSKRNFVKEVKEVTQETRKKVDYTQGKLEGLEIVKNKEQEVDKGKQPKAHVKDASHKLVLNTENSDLLGFQTGLVTFKPRPPKTEEKAPYQKKERAPVEENQQQQQPEGEVEGNVEVEGEENQERRGGAGRGARRGGSGRGARRGGAGRGDGGYNRGEGYNRGAQTQASKKKDVVLNLEDDRDFPSLA